MGACEVTKILTGAADLGSVKLGVVYQVSVPRTGEHWTLYRIVDDCGVDSIESLEVPDGWEDAYEYAKGDVRIWPRFTRLAEDADLAHATLEVSLVPVDDGEMDTDSYALLYRLSRPY